MPEPSATHTESHQTVIIGAGIAGLCAARRLAQADPANPPLILEASDQPGGRIRTDTVDGFLLDRGFQVFLDAYPEAQQILDYDALELRPFYPGALVFVQDKPHRIADPFRKPLDAARAFFSPVANTLDKARLAELDLKIRARSLASLWALPEATTLESLQKAGFAPTTIERFFRPFFGGVFFDPSLRTSARMFRFVYRMFASGNTTIPARGMQRIPEQIAAALPPGTLRTSTPIAAIERDGDTLILRTADNTPIRAHSVIIATDQTTAARLLNSLGIQPPGTNPGAPPAWRPTATIWFDAPASPTDNEPILVLDGDAQGPINHLMTLSDASRDYAPPGRHLVSASIIDEHALALDDQELLDRAIAQADRWFNNAASAWRTLRIDRIPQALPNQFAPRLEHPQRPVRVDGNIFACGDWLDNASINGAMESGRRAAALELSRRGIDPTRNAPTTDGADA